MQLSFEKRGARASLSIILFFAWDFVFAAKFDSKGNSQLHSQSIYCSQVLGIKDHDVHFQPSVLLDAQAKLQKVALPTRQQKFETLAHYLFSRIVSESSPGSNHSGISSHPRKIKLIVSDNSQEAQKMKEYLQQRDAFQEIAIKQHAVTLLPSLSVLEDSVFNRQQTSQPILIIVTLVSLIDWLDEQARTLHEDRRLVANELLKLTSTIVLSEISGPRSRDFTPIRTYLRKKSSEYQFALVELIDTEDTAKKPDEINGTSSFREKEMTAPSARQTHSQSESRSKDSVRVLDWARASSENPLRNIQAPHPFSFDMKMRILTSMGLPKFSGPKTEVPSIAQAVDAAEAKGVTKTDTNLPNESPQNHLPTESELLELIRHADSRIPQVSSLYLAFPKDSQLTLGKLAGLARYIEGLFSSFKDQTLRNVLNNRIDFPFINGTFQMVREMSLTIGKDLRWYHLISRKTALRILLLKPSMIDEESRNYILGRIPQVQFQELANLDQVDSIIGIETDHVARFESWVLSQKPEDLRNRIAGKNLEIPGLPKRYFETIREKFPDDWTASLSYECVTRIRETGKIKFSPGVTKLFGNVEREIKTYRSDYNGFLNVMRSKFKIYLHMTDANNGTQGGDLSKKVIGQSIRNFNASAVENSFGKYGSHHEELGSIASKKVPREEIVRRIGKINPTKIPKNIDELIAKASVEYPTLVQLELVYPGTSLQHRKMFLEHIIDSSKSQLEASDEEIREASIEAMVSTFALIKADLSNLESVKEQFERSLFVVPAKVLLRSLKLVPELATQTLLDFGSGKISLETAIRRINATHKTKVGTVMMSPSDQLISEAGVFQRWYLGMTPEAARAALRDPEYKLPAGLSLDWLQRFINENTRMNGRIPWYTIFDIEMVISLYLNKFVHFDTDAESFVNSVFQMNLAPGANKERK